MCTKDKAPLYVVFSILLLPRPSWAQISSRQPSAYIHSSIKVSDQVSHPHKTTDRVLILYVLILTFSDSKLEDKIFRTEWQQAFPDFNLFLIPSRIEFWLVRVVPKCSNCSTVPNNLLPICMFPFCSAFWSRDMATHLVFSAFTFLRC
jgi:hypothetical protein